MPTCLQRLRQDHRDMSVVLTSMEEQVDRVTRCLQPDMALLNAVVSYFRNYVVAVHQPKEEVIFGHLIGRVKNFAGVLAPLLADHRALAPRVDKLEEVLTAMGSADQAAFNRFCEIARRFIQVLRGHLSAKEKYLFREAERFLNAQEWAEVERCNPDLAEPLSQGPAQFTSASAARATRLTNDVVFIGASHASPNDNPRYRDRTFS